MIYFPFFRRGVSFFLACLIGAWSGAQAFSYEKVDVVYDNLRDCQKKTHPSSAAAVASSSFWGSLKSTKEKWDKKYPYWKMWVSMGAVVTLGVSCGLYKIGKSKGTLEVAPLPSSKKRRDRFSLVMKKNGKKDPFLEVSDTTEPVVFEDLPLPSEGTSYKKTEENLTIGMQLLEEMLKNRASQPVIKDPFASPDSFLGLFSMPNEIRGHIFSYLSLRDTMNCVVAFKGVKTKDTWGQTRTGDSLIGCFSPFVLDTSVLVDFLEHHGSEENLLERINSLSFKKLDLKGTRLITGSLLEKILENIKGDCQELSLSDFELTQQASQNLGKFIKRNPLRKLKLFRVQMNKEGLKSILKDDSLSELTSLTLKRISFGKKHSYDDFMETFSLIPESVRELKVGPLTSREIKDLGKMQNLAGLKRLSLLQSYHDHGGLNEAYPKWEDLFGNPVYSRLESLKFCADNILFLNDALGFSYLGTFPLIQRLKELSISSNSGGNTVMNTRCISSIQWGEMPRLEKLSLDGYLNFTQSAWLDLAGVAFPSLKFLSLKGVRIEDNLFIRLRQNPSLRRLQFLDLTGAMTRGPMQGLEVDYELLKDLLNLDSLETIVFTSHHKNITITK